MEVSIESKQLASFRQFIDKTQTATTTIQVSEFNLAVANLIHKYEQKLDDKFKFFSLSVDREILLELNKLVDIAAKQYNDADLEYSCRYLLTLGYLTLPFYQEFVDELKNILTKLDCGEITINKYSVNMQEVLIERQRLLCEKILALKEEIKTIETMTSARDENWRHAYDVLQEYHQQELNKHEKQTEDRLALKDEMIVKLLTEKQFLNEKIMKLEMQFRQEEIKTKTESPGSLPNSRHNSPAKRSPSSMNSKVLANSLASGIGATPCRLSFDGIEYANNEDTTNGVPDFDELTSKFTSMRNDKN